MSKAEQTDLFDKALACFDEQQRRLKQVACARLQAPADDQMRREDASAVGRQGSEEP